MPQQRAARASLRWRAALHERIAGVARARERPHLTSDLLDICKKYRADRDGVLRATCDHLLGNEMSSSGAPEINHVLSLEECRVIANRLNELYGIR